MIATCNVSASRAVRVKQVSDSLAFLLGFCLLTLLLDTVAGWYGKDTVGATSSLAIMCMPSVH